MIRESGVLGASALATGSAGNVTVNASTSVDVSGRTAGFLLPSQIISTAQIIDSITQAIFGLPAVPTGNAGFLTINTPSLRITDGAAVTVKNDGPGSAGNVTINADSIVVDNRSSITASTASGNGGDIRLNAQAVLLMRHGSLISATAAGAGDGGNLLMNAPVIVGLENSDIIANAVKGRGGTINITTQGIFGLNYRAQLTPENDITASSEFGVNGTVKITTPGVDPNAGLVALPLNLTDSSQHVAQGCAGEPGQQFCDHGAGRGAAESDGAGEERSPLDRHPRPLRLAGPRCAHSSSPSISISHHGTARPSHGLATERQWPGGTLCRHWGNGCPNAPRGNLC